MQTGVDDEVSHVEIKEMFRVYESREGIPEEELDLITAKHTTEEVSSCFYSLAETLPNRFVSLLSPTTDLLAQLSSFSSFSWFSPLWPVLASSELE